MPFARPLPILVLCGAALLSSCLKKSLDIYTPADAHEYVDLCVQDVGPDCEALLPTVKTLVKTLGPEISVLINNGDFTERFTAYAQAHGLTLEGFLSSPLREKYARANIFPVGRLTTGTFRTLDGTPHTFVCQDDYTCVMDGNNAIAHSMPAQRNGLPGDHDLSSGLTSHPLSAIRHLRTNPLRRPPHRGWFVLLAGCAELRAGRRG